VRIDLHFVTLAHEVHGVTLLNHMSHFSRDHVGSSEYSYILHVFSTQYYWRFHSHYFEGVLKLVDDHCRQCLSLEVLCNDHYRLVSLFGELHEPHDLSGALDDFIYDHNIHTIIIGNLLFLSCLLFSGFYTLGEVGRQETGIDSISLKIGDLGLEMSLTLLDTNSAVFPNFAVNF
jgi:hypothetical protein